MNLNHFRIRMVIIAIIAIDITLGLMMTSVAHANDSSGYKVVSRQNRPLALFMSSTAITMSASSSVFGQKVTFTATVTGTSTTPTGNVTFQDGGVNIETCAQVPLDVSAQAICATSGLTVGLHSITANYSGDLNYDPSIGTLTHQVLYVGYLPNVMLSPTVTPPPGPRPGFWQSAAGPTFTVYANGTLVINFADYFNFVPCGIYHYQVTNPNSVPIVINSQYPNGHFAFGGAFYADVTFDSLTTAHGQDGLSSYPVPNCGNATGGPFPFNANWISSAPPALPSFLLGSGHEILLPGKPQ